MESCLMLWLHIMQHTMQLLLHIMQHIMQLFLLIMPPLPRIMQHIMQSTTQLLTRITLQITPLKLWLLLITPQCWLLTLQLLHITPPMARSLAPIQPQLCHTLQFIMTQGFPILQLTMQQWLLFTQHHITQHTMSPPQFTQHTLSLPP